VSTLRSLSLPQRLVLVVGLGLGLFVACGWWYLGELQDTNGWFTTLPAVQSTDQYFVVRERQPEELLVAIAAVIFWTVASVWLLGLRPTDARAEGPR
jgi:hypothetical protein